MVAGPVLLWTGLALAAGCGAPPEEPVDEPSELLGPLDDLARRFGRLRRRLETRGYGQPTQAFRTFVLQGEGEALPVDLATGTCTTWVALGGGGLRDLGMTVFDGDGAEVASDAVRGEGALVHVCPPQRQEDTVRRGFTETAPYYVELDAADGSGAVVVGSFVSAVGAGEGFADLFEGLLVPPVPFVEVEAALTEARETLRERGMQPEGEPDFERMVAGRSWRRPIALEAGRCYAVVARGGAGVEDVDLYLYDAVGAEVARDLGQDAAPRLEHCVDEDESATLELRVFAGQGAVGVLAFSAPQSEHVEPTHTTEENEEEPIVVLGETLREFEARGFDDVLYVVRDAAINPGESRTHRLTLGPGCALLAGAGGPEELDLDLYLADDTETVDRDTRVHRRAWVAACPAVATPYRVTVKAYGRGRYALARVVASTGEGALPAITDIARVRLALAMDADAADAPVETYVVGPDEPVEIRVPRNDGCVDVAVAASESVLDVDLLLREGDTLLASDTGPAPWARVTHCLSGPRTGPLRLQIVAYRGEGEVVLRWLHDQRPEPRVPNESPAPNLAPVPPVAPVAPIVPAMRTHMAATRAIEPQEEPFE